MYTMKQVCEMLDINYATLRFYCDEGLVPRVKRDGNNYRIFDERDVNWLTGLLCLKRCGMSIKDMKAYLHLCMQGISTINERKEMLALQREKLLEQIEHIHSHIGFIDGKQRYYDDVLAGKTAYSSNLIDV